MQLHQRPHGLRRAAAEAALGPDAELAEQGFTYILDWCADDQPFPLNVQAGRMISVPYSVELNDITLFLGTGVQGADFAQLVSDQFEVLHEESKRRPGAVMALSLHPFLINQPFRHKYLVQVLEEVRGHDDVWFATSDEIADWYLERCYDDAVAALEAARG